MAPRTPPPWEASIAQVPMATMATIPVDVTVQAPLVVAGETANETASPELDVAVS
jgi:hypothetical protein